MTTALLDADIIVYKAAAIAQTTIDWDEDGKGAEYYDLAGARRVAAHVVDAWTGVAEAREPLLVFSDRTHPKASFRYRLLDTYKGNRPNHKPKLHDMVLAYLKDKYPWVDIKGLEGDDVMGLMATAAPEKYVIVSIDKDMKTLPGVTLCNPEPMPDITIISPFQADYNWMLQTLTGDPTDNYKGCPGIGKAKGARALMGCRTLVGLWRMVTEAYYTQSKDPRWGEKFEANGRAMRPTELALLNARVARILRDGDYDAEGRRVRLWAPTGEPEWLSLITEDGA